MPAPASKLKLPQIEHVSLRRFSLFTANPDAAFDTGSGVLCLVGANGIGKSTLLAAINFCLTGTVADPNRSFESMEEYYRFTRAYSGGYFRGRINGNDEEDAEITVRFRLGSHRYDVRRGMFEPEELRGLTVTDVNTNEPISLGADLTRGDKHREYVDHFVLHSGLSSFEEFVFLQHFVFTFDEQRKTIFWNQPVLERALYRAFGLEPDMAKRADSLRREIDQEDSRVRNYQWEATRMRKRINEIRAQSQTSVEAKQQYEALVVDHETLSKQFDEETKTLGELVDAINDENLKLAECSVRETALRDEYAQFFDRRFNRRPVLSQLPLVTRSVKDHACGMCGSTTDSAMRILVERVSASVCPLCDSPIEETAKDEEDSGRLQMIDKELADVTAELRGVHKRLQTLRAAEEDARARWETTKETLDGFERNNSAAIESLRNQLNRGTTDASLTDYRDQLGVLERDKKTAYSRREELKVGLLALQRALEQEYLAAETTFVPRFAELAHHFLGMPLTVQMEARATRGLDLVVSVRGTTRRQQQQLSESQRFFVDIALRMALTQHMSDPTSRGGMIIDTPEGSLDIAYEKRAGDMLAMFAEAGHQILMTANLNSSQLLLALARRCGHANMRLYRMTDWAELSEVQQEEEELFDTAYEQLEIAMNSKVQDA